MSPQPKVLVFTASAKRPIYLRHCLLQMQQQTYPLDHAVYLNSPEYKSPDTDPHNYMSLVDDIVITKGKKIQLYPLIISMFVNVLFFVHLLFARLQPTKEVLKSA